MLRKTTVAVAAALTVGVAFIASDALAASERNRASATGTHVSHNTGVHATGQRHRHVGYRGGYGPGYGYDNGYNDPGYYGYGGPCLVVPVPIIGCW